MLEGAEGAEDGGDGAELIFRQVEVLQAAERLNGLGSYRVNAAPSENIRVM